MPDTSCAKELPAGERLREAIERSIRIDPGRLAILKQMRDPIPELATLVAREFARGHADACDRRGAGTYGFNERVAEEESQMDIEIGRYVLQRVADWLEVYRP